MISPNELRKGNLFNPISRHTEVHLPQTAVFFEVVEILLFNVTAVLVGKNPAQIENIPEFKYADISPIPVSPEILEKCGFLLNGFKEYELTLNNQAYSCVNKKLIFSGDYLYLEEWPKDTPAKDRSIVTIWNKDLMKKFYLHKLQNLVFDLSGEELQINL